MHAKRTLRWVWNSLGASALIILLAIGIIWWMIYMANERFDFSGLVARFESGEIGLGAEVRDVLGQGKPVIDSAAGDFFTLAYSHEDQILVLYGRTDSYTFFAAQYLEWQGAPTETWYFCDAELMARYLDAATRPRSD